MAWGTAGASFFTYQLNIPRGDILNVLYSSFRAEAVSQWQYHNTHKDLFHFIKDIEGKVSNRHFKIFMIYKQRKYFNITNLTCSLYLQKP
jgi:hypothetical protein